MNYCQVEVDTAKYYKARDAQEAAEEAAAEEADFQVHFVSGDYFWAAPTNLSEALGEALCQTKFEKELATMILTKPEAVAEFLKKTSVNYWTNYLIELAD